MNVAPSQAPSVATKPGYPLEFPKNQWYVAGHAEDFGRELKSRWILGEPICFYRTQDNTAVALADRCIHRQMPLSKGFLQGNNVRCAYHGILYGEDGMAREIPSQSNIPEKCRVHRYPLVESGGLFWIWMGDAAKADRTAIPSHPWLDDPKWVAVRGTLHMKARAQLLNENLLDLSHLSYLHPGSIGSDDVVSAPTTMEFDERSVRVIRDMNNAISPPMFIRAMGLEGKIDRHQVAEFIAPGFHVTHLDAKATGERDTQVFSHKAIHCITPERANSAHYFWTITRNYRIDDEEVSRLWREGAPRVFGEDIDASEAIEQVLAAYEPGYPPELDLKVDGGPLRARRIIERLIAQERRGNSVMASEAAN